MSKRIVSLILTLVMLLTALPLGVFAEEEQQNLTPSVAVETVEAPAAEQPKTEEPETPAQPAAQESEAPAEQPKAEEAPVQPAVKQELSEQPVAKQEEKEEPVVIGFFAGFSNASSVLVGTEVGAGRPDVAYSRAWRLVYLCQGFIALLGVLLIALHTPILKLMGMSGDSFTLAFGMIAIYVAFGIIRMGNWTQNDTFRAAGDATYGTVLEIVFMWAMILPLVCVSGLVLKWPTLAVFALCYADEPIRYILMQKHLFSGKWIRPVTPEGQEALRGWRTKRALVCEED